VKAATPSEQAQLRRLLSSLAPKAKPLKKKTDETRRQNQNSFEGV
jgi:hypothetical protein